MDDELSAAGIDLQRERFDDLCKVHSLVAVSRLSQNPIVLSAKGLVRLSESRFPKLSEVRKNRKRLWKDWKTGSRAQGRCATRLRYSPTFAALLILVRCHL